MIADEIVHNSIPEDRIQFATTCKAFNQLFKHAKPKKIINFLRLNCYETDSSLYINSGNERIMTLPELKNFIQQYQVENLSFCTADWVTDKHLYSELMEILMEPCRFVTVLSITSDDPELKYVDFYKKLKHLQSFKVYDPTEVIMDLPYFPPKLELQSEYYLPWLAEKTLNHPLSFLKINRPVQLTDVQQFLMRANFEIGAEIRFRFNNESKIFKGFLTFIGNGLFEFEMFRGSEYLILDQQVNSQNKKILKLSTDFWLWFDEKVPFTVKSVSNPGLVVCSGKLTRDSREKTVFENVDECVKVLNPRHSTYYSPKLLDNWFPRTENYDPFDRVETVNKALGTNISVVTPEMLEERTESQYLQNFM
uniref:DUF38 domain-containing protein n=1 Tax=Panagrolaimus sp. JU765 TaxID=591449 RepID=A0AC34QB13_9BILA